MEEALNRSRAYIDAGADLIFPESLNTLENFKTFANEIRKHKRDVLLLANMTEFGKTEYINFEDFTKCGYNIVIYPVSTLRVAMRAAEDLLKVIKKEGSQRSQLGRMYTRSQLYNDLQYSPNKEWDYRSFLDKFDSHSGNQ